MTDDLADVARALAGRWDVQGVLGRGGMATVYLARDLKHDRQVAVKVLRPELAASLGPDRFLREIQIAAKLSHPHILPLFDSAEIGGRLLYVMPYVAGESLRQRLDRSGPLPIAEALELATQVARALDHAHVQGIVHRDIKPENILLQSGQAVVSDFGIARAIDAAVLDRPSQGTLTETGVVVGTPRYMSPEQILGDRVDARSDVYSLGCVVYEMLAGAPPFEGSTAHGLAAKHTLGSVPSLRKRRPEVGRDLEAAVLRALAKGPEGRFDTAGKFAEGLAGAAAGGTAFRRRLALAGLLVLAVMGTVAGGPRLLGMLRGLRGGATESRPARLAVLYFDLVSRDSSDQYLADGISEEMIFRLGEIPRLAVKSRASVRPYRGRVVEDPSLVGQALDVRYLLTGSVQPAGSHLRVLVELVEAATGRKVWNQAFTSDARDALVIQDSIAQAVAGEVLVRLGPAERAILANAPTSNREAYDHYLKGNFYMARRTSEADGRRALAEYDAALRLDPRFAAASGRLGLLYGIYASWPWAYPGLTTDSLIARGLVAAQRAIEFDSASADGWLARGFLLIPAPANTDAVRGFTVAPLLLNTTARCWSGATDCLEQALLALKRAVDLAPRNAEVWYQYGRANVVAGSLLLADSAIERSLALEPDRAVSAWLLSISAFRQRRWERAETSMDSAVALGRRDRSAYSVLLQARLAQGNLAGAEEDLRAYGLLVGGDSVAMVFHEAMRAAIAARRGDTAMARAVMDSALRRFPPERITHPTMRVALAAGLVSVGEGTRGLPLLMGLSPEGGRWLKGWWLQNPLWDPVRNSPQFQRLRSSITAEQPRPAGETARPRR